MAAPNPAQSTFLVKLKTAEQFLRCLTMMMGVAPSAALVVRNRKIQIVTHNADDVYASVEMDASFASSWGFKPFAIRVNLVAWIDLLSASIAHQKAEPLWIYQIGVSPGVYCLIGNDSRPIRLGVPKFLKEKTIPDDKFLRRLASGPIQVNMPSESMREMISALAPRFYNVGLMVREDRVTWHTVGGEFTYDELDGECEIEGVEEGTAHYMVVKWRSPWVLEFASEHCSDVIMSCCLVQDDWMGWIRFSCLLDGIISFMYLMRGSTYQVHL